MLWLDGRRALAAVGGLQSVVVSARRAWLGELRCARLAVQTFAWVRVTALLASNILRHRGIFIVAADLRLVHHGLSHIHCYFSAKVLTDWLRDRHDLDHGLDHGLHQGLRVVHHLLLRLTLN